MATKNSRLKARKKKQSGDRRPGYAGVNLKLFNWTPAVRAAKKAKKKRAAKRRRKQRAASAKSYGRLLRDMGRTVGQAAAVQAARLAVIL